MSVKPAVANPFARFERALTDAATTMRMKRVGLAVSGGGDSIAMMHMAVRALGKHDLFVLTVDHGLRLGARAEIALVAEQASALGLPHSVATWKWDGTGNLQAAARTGRWDHIRSWGQKNNLDTFFLGHTEDDQVETLLMRLSRGSGIDGLTGMSHRTVRDGLQLLRPLLHVSRDDLRDWLREQDISWCEDPSNDDPQFARVRARQMFAQLQSLGLTRKRLLQTADHAQAARRSLQKAAQEFARRYVKQDAGDLLFASEALKLDHEDAPRRVMAAAISWINGNAYRPRFERMLETVDKVGKGRTVTLGGCLLSALPDGSARITREAAATKPYRRKEAGIVNTKGILWDGRWFLEGQLEPDLTFCALGKAVDRCPDWRETGIPRSSLLASPSIWSEDVLLAAPLAGLRNGWTAQIVADFHSTAFEH